MNKNMMIAVITMCAMMAQATTNEIQVNVSLKVDKNSTQLSKSSGSQAIQFNGSKFYSRVYSLTTTNTPMEKGSIGNLGWCYMRSLVVVSTNAMPTINISFDATATTNMQLLASEAVLFRLAPSFQVTNIHAAVSSGSGDFEFTVIEK